MTDPDDNPFAPPEYPPPAGPAFGEVRETTTGNGFSAPVPSEPRTEAADWSVFENPSSDPVTQQVAGVATEQVSGPPAPTNRSASRALLLGASAIVLTPVAGLAAIAIARRAKDEIRETGEGGAGLARAGAWLGGAFSLLWLFGAAFLIAMAIGSVAA